MLNILVRLFIKDKDNIDSPKVRAAYATVSGILGIALNIFLFAAKGLVGFISGSISVIADAFNNLTDAGASIITMVGFRIAGHDADSDHPFGHGRSEYITGLVVSFLILLVGAELIITSVKKIISPEKAEYSVYLVIALIVSMVVKFYMYCYNRRLAVKLDAAAFNATAKDSINDVITTGVVLIAALINHYTSVNVDGFCGILVGLIILKGGIEIFKETSGLIMGHGADPEFKDKIYDIVNEYEDILGIHDLIVHDYGPGRRMISFHAEVSSSKDILEIHDMIDNLERDLQHRLKTQAVVHMDPIVTDDETINNLRRTVEQCAGTIGEGVFVHDFRVVHGPTHTNLIFDIVLPFEAEYSPKEAKKKITEMLLEKDPSYYAVITVDRPA